MELRENKSKCILEEEGAVAQLIERRIRIAEARGLNPLSSTKDFQEGVGRRPGGGKVSSKL